MRNANALRKKLADKIATLPASQLQPVLEFISRLEIARNGTDDPILDVAGCLSGKPMSAKEIEEELYGRD